MGRDMTSPNTMSLSHSTITVKRFGISMSVPGEYSQPSSHSLIKIIEGGAPKHDLGLLSWSSWNLDCVDKMSWRILKGEQTHPSDIFLSNYLPSRRLECAPHCGVQVDSGRAQDAHVLLGLGSPRFTSLDHFYIAYVSRACESR